MNVMIRIVDFFGKRTRVLTVEFELEGQYLTGTKLLAGLVEIPGVLDQESIL